MARYKIEFVGLPREVVNQGHIVLEFNRDPGVEAIIHEIKLQIPAMSGPVFSKEKNILTRHYIFYINGRFHLSDSDITISPEDHVVLMNMPLGG